MMVLFPTGFNIPNMITQFLFVVCVPGLFLTSIEYTTLRNTVLFVLHRVSALINRSALIGPMTI